MENTIPTDSVLRRHYESTHGKARGNAGASKSGGGLMCWLKKLIGG